MSVHYSLHMNEKPPHSTDIELHFVDQKAALTKDLHERYGAMIGGAELRTVLKFRTASAFYKALKQGKLGVHVFRLEGRQGFFCMTADVVEWMLAVSQRPNVDDTHLAQSTKSRVKGEAS